MSLVGYRIFERRTLLAPTLIERFAGLGTAQIGDCMGRLYGIRGLRPLNPGGAALRGSALTVKVRPGDNLLIHKAIAMGAPGDVIVVDGGGELANALIGELMMLDARFRGVAGFVIDGAVRDVDTLSQADFPCFARGVSYQGPYKDGPGEINVPVAVGGQVVEPGDLIIGDADGVLAVPASLAEGVLALALEKERGEARIKEKIAAGTYKKPWVDETLAQKTAGA